MTRPQTKRRCDVCPLFCLARAKHLAIFSLFLAFFSIVVVVRGGGGDFQVKSAATSKGFGCGYGNFCAVEFLCENVKRLTQTNKNK